MEKIKFNRLDKAFQQISKRVGFNSKVDGMVRKVFLLIGNIKTHRKHYSI